VHMSRDDDQGTSFLMRDRVTKGAQNHELLVCNGIREKLSTAAALVNTFKTIDRPLSLFLSKAIRNVHRAYLRIRRQFESAIERRAKSAKFNIRIGRIIFSRENRVRERMSLILNNYRSAFAGAKRCIPMLK
jgi:hypothetical protein